MTFDAHAYAAWPEPLSPSRAERGDRPARATAFSSESVSVAVITAVSILASILVTAGTMYLFIGVDGSLQVNVGQFWKIGLSISVFAPCVIAPTVSFRILTLMRKLQHAHDQLDQLAKRDALTGLLNRRGLDSAAAAVWRKTNGPVSALMCDIDRFKAINDTFGHDAGDLALIQVAQILRQTVRLPDAVLARQGGEEFVVLLPGVDAAAARAAAEAVRAACERAPLQWAGAHAPVTLSVGVAVQPMRGATLRDLLSAADKALYLAKQQGRNRVVVGSEEAGRQ